jgi:hypothetical protein
MRQRLHDKGGTHLDNGSPKSAIVINIKGPITISRVELGTNGPPGKASANRRPRISPGSWKALRERIGELELALAAKRQLIRDFQTIDRELHSRCPRHSMVNDSLSSMRSVLESCVGTVIASEILKALVALVC